EFSPAFSSGVCGRRLCCRFGKKQLAGSRVVIEDLCVASPLESGLQLPLYFVLAEVFIQDVVEKFVRDGMIRLPPQDRIHLLKQRHMLQGSFPEERFS